MAIAIVTPSNQSEQDVDGGGKLLAFDKISERLIGWACLGLSGTEWVDPSIFQIDTSQALGFAVFGFFVATGRANEITKYLAEKILK